MPCILSAFADESGSSGAEQIAGLRRAGFKHIDIRSIDGHNITVLPLEQARQIRPQLDAAGIGVNMFGSPLGKIDLADDFSTDVAKLRHMGALAPILGCTDIRIFSYYNKTAKPHAAFQREALERLDELAKVASDLGLVLYHENESNIFGDKAADVLTIARELRAKWGNGKGCFRMIFDFGNYNNGREDVWQCWQMLRDSTDAFHLKDNVWQDPATIHHVPVGQGGGQVVRILTDAVTRKFTGPLTVEPHLQHSAAVAATGPSGIANAAYSQMSAADSFHIACMAGREVCQKAGLATDAG
ncbi:MAG: TIM barrel protein [Phycisphaerae bacterium]